MESGWLRDHWLFGFLLPVVVLCLVVAACGGDNGDALAPVSVFPGLAEADEVPLIETEPDPNDDSFNWTHAYRVGDLPPINVGQPTADFMADAHRDPEGAADLVCMGAGGGSGCGEMNSPGPEIMGINYGGLDVLAWACIGVPDEAAAVQFIDQDGTASWQRPAPAHRLVIFPDTIEGDPDAECPCRFDALDADGAVITSVDIRTLSYSDG